MRRRLCNADVTIRLLSDSYKISRRLWPHSQKKFILVIFGKFKKRNPCAVGFFHQILDWNVVVKSALGELVPTIKSPHN